MKTINSFGLSKEQKKNMIKWAEELYDKLEENNHDHRMILASNNVLQNFLNDFFLLKRNPWGCELDYQDFG